MSLCCIGGVCVPYTAVIPVLLLALKWLAAKLASYGLLPDSVVKALGVAASSSKEKSECCDGTNGSTTKYIKAPPVLSASTQVKVVDNEGIVDAFLKQNETVVLKFTATWCMPCKAIAPTYAELASQYAAHFLEVDVDEYDELAAQYKIAVMPTFCIVTGETVETMTGSNPANLTTFVDRHLSKR
jgi:thiol-disulfide isomerase/thioredoxin